MFRTPEQQLRWNFGWLVVMALLLSFRLGLDFGAEEPSWWLLLVLIGLLVLLRKQFRAMTQEDRSDAFVRRWMALQPSVNGLLVSVGLAMVLTSGAPKSVLREVVFWSMSVLGAGLMIWSIAHAWKVLRPKHASATAHLA